MERVHTCRWIKMRRYRERSSNAGPLLPRPFCPGCIISTRGYDFRKGQGLPVSFDRRMSAECIGRQSWMVQSEPVLRRQAHRRQALRQTSRPPAVITSQDFHRKQLIELASQHRLPSIWEGGAYVRDGGLLAYGPSFPDMYRRSAGYVAKIINGAKPSALPVEQPIRFELAVNTKTAQTLRLVVPPRLISRADEVIE